MENKLITLFKQCCDNSEFTKVHKESSLNRNNYSVSEQPFEINKEITKLLNSGGYLVEDIDKHYTSSSYGRVFEFDGEPPLEFRKASIKLTLLMDEQHIRLGDIESDKFIEKKEVWKKNFWGNENYREEKITHEFLKRSIEIDARIMNGNHNIWLMNQKENSFSFCPRWLHRHQRDKAIVVTRNFDTCKASNWWFQKDIEVVVSASDFNDFKDYDVVYSGIRHDHMEVNGGLLSFGDVWLWLDWDTYTELDKYYTDSIKKTHEVILEQRLKETKKA